MTALRELNREEAALGRGVPDAVDRLRKLAARLNNLDPYSSFGTSTSPDGSVSVSMVPRYAGADQDRLVEFGGNFVFTDDEEGRATAKALQEAFDYGRPVTVPGKYVKSLNVDLPGGMGGSFEGGELTISPTSGNLDSLKFSLRVLDSDTGVVADLPLRTINRSVGRRGAELTLRDHSGP